MNKLESKEGTQGGWFPRAFNPAALLTMTPKHNGAYSTFYWWCWLRWLTRGPQHHRDASPLARRHMLRPLTSRGLLGPKPVVGPSPPWMAHGFLLRTQNLPSPGQELPLSPRPAPCHLHADFILFRFLQISACTRFRFSEIFFRICIPGVFSHGKAT